MDAHRVAADDEEPRVSDVKAVSRSRKSAFMRLRMRDRVELLAELPDSLGALVDRRRSQKSAS